MAKTKPAAKQTDNAHTRDTGEYTVVARRYRPQQFADLIGQEHVAQALTNAITSGRIAHAYLFTGARGTGKTSTARILAKALNCVKGPTPSPCDQCDICQAIAAGDDVDVLEIDGASNNKVDEVRELRSNVGFRPTRTRYKIYIIDEVHMLSNSAFNALLKTLEEPPSHVKFIFATTEVNKLPITVLSRCQRFDFAHVSTQKIFEQLKHIVAKEGLQADDDALQIVARRAAGSMRDSQSLLDQLLAFADGTLTAEKVHALLGTAGDDRVAALAEAILNRDARYAVELVGQFAERGLQLGELLDQLIDYWRGLMLVHAAGPDYSDLPGTPAFQERIKEHAVKTNLDTVLAGLDILTTTKGKMRGSSHVQILLEIAVVRLARLDELLSVSQLAQALADGGRLVTEGSVKAESTSARSGDLSQVVDVSKKKSLVDQNSRDTETKLTEATLPNLWERVLDEVGPIRANHLRRIGLPAIFGPNSLAIRVPASYTAYDFCGDDRTCELVQAALKRMTGIDWLVRVEKVAGSANGLMPEPSSAGGTVNRTKDFAQSLLFRRIGEVLGGQLLNPDTEFNPTVSLVADDETPDTDEREADV
jgi:DNA polymerase-3 subunit gamma/tau